MKNTKNKTIGNDDLQPEYDLDFSKSKPNRFSKSLQSQSNFIQLEPDVHKVFRNSDEVNNALRAVINAMPKRKKNKSQEV